MGKISSAVILAAGYSTRLGQPKALVMWNEETLIERSIRLLEDAGIKKIVVVTNKELMAAFIPLVGNHSIVVNPSPGKWTHRFITDRDKINIIQSPKYSACNFGCSC